MENLMLSISGMHCATCAQKIEKVLAATKGVLSITVNFSTESAAVSYDEHVIDEKKILRVIEKVGYKAEKSIAENQRQKERKKMKKKWLARIIISFVLSVLVIFSEWFISFVPWLPIQLLNPLLLLITFAILYFGAFEILNKSFQNIISFTISKNLLPGVGLIVLTLYTTVLTIVPSLSSHISRPLLYTTLCIIVLIYTVLRWYELSIDQSIKENFENLMNLHPKTARVVRHGNEIEVKVQDVKVGNLVKVKAGETIPVDGIIFEGTTKINEAIITGSGTEVEKKSGDEVITATINIGSTIIYKVTQVGDSTTLSQMLSLIEDSKKFKGRNQKIGMTLKKIISVLILIIAFGTGIAWIATGNGMFICILSTVSILLIVNPNTFEFGALSPYSYGIEKAATRGMLFKGGKIIDNTSKIKRIVFDKTGTLTYGIPEVTNIIPKEGFNDKRFLILLGSLENSSAHPFATTIVEYCKTKKITLKKAYDFKSIEGMGIKGIVDGQEIIAGNMKLMEKSNVQMNSELLHKAEILSKNVRTPIFVARNRELIGVVGIADTIKENAKEAISELNKKRYSLTLITGDNEKIAEFIAGELRIKDVLADMLQKEKIEAIQNFQDKKEVVAFVGDGINDATALAQADVGISIGTGTDSALEASDITFISDDLRLIVSVLNISQIIRQVARQNMIFNFVYHLIAVPAAAGISYLTTGFILHPAIAPLIMGLSFFALAKNTLRLKKLINS